MHKGLLRLMNPGNLRIISRSFASNNEAHLPEITKRRHVLIERKKTSTYIGTKIDLIHNQF